MSLVAGEMMRDEETGFWVPAYPEVTVTIPRQAGKTTWLLAEECDRCWLFESFDGAPQRVAYTAQTGSDARKKFRQDQIPILKKSRFWRPGTKARLSADDTGVEFANGSSISVWANSDSAGHGSTIDLGVLDEIFADTDDRREQALLPAMATRHDRQKLITSTAGTEESVVLDRKQEMGRGAVAENKTEGIAYFEWSADPDDDPEDPATWESCNPALGFTITHRSVAAALTEMRQPDGDISEFKRAWLNIPTKAGGDAVIPAPVWRAVCRDTSPRPAAGLTLGIDANPDRDYASIAAADRQGNCELIEHRQGVGWVLERVLELSKTWSAEIVVDLSGPLGGLAESLRLAKRRVYSMQPREVAYATGDFYDRVADGLISVYPNPSLDAAVAGAQRRQVGDGWVWQRRSHDTDISPLVALTIALNRAVRKRVSAYESRVAQ